MSNLEFKAYTQRYLAINVSGDFSGFLMQTKEGGYGDKKKPVIADA